MSDSDGELSGNRTDELDEGTEHGPDRFDGVDGVDGVDGIGE